MRVLVTGMGGELGTRVAQLLEERDEVEEIVGVDFVPPRRRLRRSEFRRIDPRDRDKLVGVRDRARAPGRRALRRVRARLAPEPVDARRVHRGRAPSRPWAPPRGRASSSASSCAAGSRSTDAVRDPPRSRRGRAARADARPYGRSVLEVETMAAALVRRLRDPGGVAAAAHRSLGSHVPSPLGRLLRLPAVPVPAFADPPFQLLHQEDAARAMVEALLRGVDGPLNVVGDGCREHVAGRPARGTGSRCRWSDRSGRSRARSPRSRARRCRPTCSSSCAGVGPATPAAQRGARARPSPVDARRVHGAVRVGHRDPVAQRRAGGMRRATAIGVSPIAASRGAEAAALPTAGAGAGACDGDHEMSSGPARSAESGRR